MVRTGFVVLALALAGFAAAPQVWGPCTDLPPLEEGQPKPDPGLECAKLKVPLDYTRPDGDTIDLALARIKTTGQGQRIGSLIFNPGGPGSSGVEMLAGSSGDYKELGKRYDLVSFDPRGVGRSDPVKCLDDKQVDEMTAHDVTPDTPAEEQVLVNDQKTTVAACEANSGKVLPYVSTLSAAKDVDAIRKALGDDKLHYFGISYGTWLGGNNAHQFPANVGRMVLDGAVDTKLSTENLNLQQAAAFERALGNYASWVADQPEMKKAGITKERYLAGVTQVLKGLDAKPAPTGDPARPLTESMALSGISMALYSKDLWRPLAISLDQAAAGDGTSLLMLADLQAGRDKDGHYTNLGSANQAIRCADTTKRYTEQDVKAALPKFTKASPMFGASQAWAMLSCTGWPVKGDDAAQEVSAPTAAPVVVVGNTGDPATPYAWSPALAKELGSGVLLTLKGEGHGAYDTGNKCVVDTVNAYLLNGTVPPKGKTCT